jgi:CHAT domain-containing protein/Tfp pilus assembly protein PilF
LLILSLTGFSSCYHQGDPRRAYEHAQRTFAQGRQAQAQSEADRGYRRFLSSSPEWSWKFRILEADALMRQGMSQEVLKLLSSPPAHPSAPQFSIPVLTLQGLAYARLHQFEDAEERLHEAERFCATTPNESSCGAVARARGVFALEQGHFSDAQKYFERTLAFARTQRDPFLESTALLNLSASALQQSHFDDAIDRSEAAYQLSTTLGAEDVAEVAVGNLGWAYYKLGDSDRALESFIAAERSAERLGHGLGRIYWLTNIGYIYLDRSEYGTAQQFYQKALTLARQIGAKEYIRNALLSLALAYERENKLGLANEYADQAIASARADGNRLDELYPLLVKAQVAVQLNNTAKASEIFREVAQDPVSDPSLRWEAQHSLAQLYQHTGHRGAAIDQYQAALCTFENARSSLEREESKLPFFTNGLDVYDDYIGLLVGLGQTMQALEVADFSRARTLEEGLGLLQKRSSCVPAALKPQSLAAKTRAAILYYWLGEKQSYLWVVTRREVRLFSLPSRSEIDALVHRYRRALEDGEDVLASSNPDGIRLYSTLIAPAAPLLRKERKIVVVADGSLNTLNFEALLVPAPNPHYWIEDATISNASSLRLLSRANASSDNRNQKLLLIGDPVTHNPEFAPLPNAKLEIEMIEKHFPPANLTAYTLSSATASAFLSSKPEQFSYIHFVAHGVASSQVPLDSAVILSAPPGEDSFRLSARDIIHHALHARLVTISACFGAGTRAYGGEGLVGLSWAFLRAGAHRVIGALWEVNDASTPQLMDDFYAQLENGLSPEFALRAAKLKLIQSNKVFAKPFYWAPFQLYTGS